MTKIIAPIDIETPAGLAYDIMASALYRYYNNHSKGSVKMTSRETAELIYELECADTILRCPERFLYGHHLIVDWAIMFAFFLNASAIDGALRKYGTGKGGLVRYYLNNRKYVEQWNEEEDYPKTFAREDLEMITLDISREAPIECVEQVRKFCVRYFEQRYQCAWEGFPRPRTPEYEQWVLSELLKPDVREFLEKQRNEAKEAEIANLF